MMISVDPEFRRLFLFQIKFKEGLKEGGSDGAHGSKAMPRSMSSSVLQQKRERESSPQPHLHRSHSEEHITLDEVVPLVADIKFLLEHFLSYFLKDIVLPKLRDLGLKNEDIIASETLFLICMATLPGIHN